MKIFNGLVPVKSASKKMNDGVVLSEALSMGELFNAGFELRWQPDVIGVSAFGHILRISLKPQC